MNSLSPVRLLATPWNAAYQAPPSMGFSRQQYCIYICIYICCHFNSYRLVTQNTLSGGGIVSFCEVFIHFQHFLMESYKYLQKIEHGIMNPHVPPPASAESAGHQSCCIVTPASPTPTPEYCGADPRPQISSSVNISLFFSKR